MSNQNYQSTFLSYVAEATPGQTPATPSMLKLRTTNPLAITGNKTLFESEEVYAHRQRQDVRHGLRTVGGNIPTELSYAAFSDWFEALLGGEWSGGASNVLKVGNNLKTFTVEQAHPQIGQYLRFLGVTPSQASITINPTGIVTVGWDVLGMDFEREATSLGAPVDVATHAPFEGLSNAVLTEGGSPIAIVTQLTLTINANKSVSGLVGSGGADVPTDGQVQVTGQLSARFRDASLYNKFEGESETSLSVTLSNPDGPEEMGISLPRLKYNSGGMQNNNNAVDVQMDFEALYDSTESSSIVITEEDNA